MKEQCEILIVYEDAITRADAVRFCDSLVQRFWSRNNFQIEWCPLTELQSEASSRKHCETAASAHILIFALRPGVSTPVHFYMWVENWLDQRGEKEGALVGLLDAPKAGESGGTYGFLRRVAHRAGMDYVTQIPNSIMHSIPDSADSFTQRAMEVTHVLDEILHEHGKPSKLGPEN